MEKEINAVYVYGLNMTKMVQLSNEAYRRLRSAKRGSESFSEVVLRLTKTGNLADLANLQTDREIGESEVFRREIDELDRQDAARHGRH